MPVVSVIIPTRDRCELLVQTLASVQAQDMDAWEAIVVDDGSSDDTAARVTELASADPRVRLVVRESEPAGAPRCRNLGTAAARGEFIVFLDSDDLLTPQCLSRRVRLMREHPDLDVGIFRVELFRQKPGDAGLMWNRDTRPGENDLDRFLERDTPWCTLSPIWRRPALDAIGGWDEKLACWQDWDINLRIVLMGLRYRQFPFRDVGYRSGDPAHASITRRYLSPASVESKQYLCGKFHRLISERGLLNARRRELLAGLYFLAAEQWEPIDRGRALAAWRECRQAGLISLRRYLRGLCYLRLRRTRWRRWATREALERSWPATMFSRPSPTLSNTPVVPDGEPAV